MLLAVSPTLLGLLERFYLARARLSIRALVADRWPRLAVEVNAWRDEYTVVSRQGTRWRPIEYRRAMASSSVEVVRTMYDGFAEGDIERAVSVVHPEVEWVELFPYAGVYNGVDALLELLSTVAGDFDLYEMDFDEWVVDGDRVVVIGTYRVRRKGRPEVFESRFVHVFWLEDGRVRRYEQITDTKTAGAVL